MLLGVEISEEGGALRSEPRDKSTTPPQAQNPVSHTLFYHLTISLLIQCPYGIAQILDKGLFDHSLPGYNRGIGGKVWCWLA